MARLIDADKFKSFLNRQYRNCHGYSGYKKELYREALRAVKSYVHSEGQIDAVPIVRCKDCKYGEVDDADLPTQYLCNYHGADWNDENHFCSYGERKEKNNGVCNTL